METKVTELSSARPSFSTPWPAGPGAGARRSELARPGAGTRASPTCAPAISAFAPSKPPTPARRRSRFGRRATSRPPTKSAADHADKLFVAINQSLRRIESEQIARVTTLAANAYETADKIAEALEAAGLPVDGDYGKQGVGGPLIADRRSAVSTPRSRNWTRRSTSSTR